MYLRKVVCKTDDWMKLTRQLGYTNMNKFRKIVNWTVTVIYQIWYNKVFYLQAMKVQGKIQVQLDLIFGSSLNRDEYLACRPASVSIEMEAGWAFELMFRCTEKLNILLLQWIEPRWNGLDSSVTGTEISGQLVRSYASRWFLKLFGESLWRGRVRPSVSVSVKISVHTSKIFWWWYITIFWLILHASPLSQVFQACSSNVMKEVEFRTYHSTWKRTRISFQKGYYLEIKMVKDIGIVIINIFTDIKTD